MAPTPTDHSQPPRWLLIALIAQAALLWGTWISLMWFARSHWDTFLSIPIDLARLMLLVGSIVLSGLAGLSIWQSRSPAAVRVYGWWQATVRTPLGWLLVVLLAAAGTWLGVNQAHIWIGRRLLSLFFLTWLLIVLLAHPDLHEESFQRRFWLIVPAIVLLLGLGVRVWWLLADMVWIDEGFHMSAAAGMLAGKNIAPANMFFPQDIIIPPWRGFAFGIYKLWAGIFGLGLLQMRAMAYLFGLLALLLLYFTIRLWYDQRTALVGVSLSSLTWLLMMSTLGRTDSLPMFAVSLTLYTHVYATRHKQLWLHAVVGLLAGLSLETHFAVAPLIFVWSAYYAIDYVIRVITNRRILQSAPLWPFIAGLLPILIAYVIVHIYLLPYPAGFFDTIARFAPKHSFILSQIRRSGIRFNQYWGEAPFEPVLIIVSTVAAILRRQESDRHWLSLFGLGVLGYTLLGSDPQIHHTIYGLPIWLAGLGPLITRGWSRDPSSLSPARLGAFIVIVCLVMNSTVQELVIDSASREFFDAEYSTVADVIRQYTHPGVAIVTPPIYIPYLIDQTHVFLHSQYPGVQRGPFLAGKEPNYYWQTILLETWPAVRIEQPIKYFEELRIQIEYFRAFQAEEIAPHIWWIDWNAWKTDLGAPPDETQTPLLLAAHQPTSSAAAGNTLTFLTIWANRQALNNDVDVTVSLKDEVGRSVAATTQPIVGGWDESQTSDWGQPSFHDATLSLALPDDLPPGAYTLTLTIEGDPGLCQPWCEMDLGPVLVP